MANPEHLKKLEEGVEAWNQWRRENPEIWIDINGANLNGANLRNANLGAADLSGADLRGADLRSADFSGANLIGVSLSRADLKWADFFEAHLHEANLRSANLVKTDFKRAVLRGADLSGANLSRAKFLETDLWGADLRGADLEYAYLCWVTLTGANLSGANLAWATLLTCPDIRGADLSDSYINQTIFHNMDISTVKGLETIKHLGPSLIGIEVIFLSKGKIPEIFLRGAGVPEIFIEYMPSLTCNPLEFYSCFISYSHANKDFARRLHDRLQGHGIRCWLDEHRLVPGDDLHDRIDQGIKLWDKVILCCSEESLTSWWVDKELDRALQKEECLWKERKEKVLAIIPVDLDGYVFSWDGGKAGMVRSRFISDFKNWKNNDEFELSFEKLLKALRTPEGREPAPTPKL